MIIPAMAILVVLLATIKQLEKGGENLKLPDWTDDDHHEIDRDEAVNLLLASIAVAEMGLAKIIGAEADKIKHVLSSKPAPSLEQILEINRSVERTLRSIISKEMLLQFQLEDVLLIPTHKGHKKDIDC